MQTKTSSNRSTNSTASTDVVRKYLSASAEVKARSAEECTAAIVAAANLIAETLHQGGKLLVCGNGGSAADSQHLAAEFVSVLDKRRTRPAMAALALTTDSSIITAIANDFGYASTFARQVEALGSPNDILVGISTSGNSENVVKAFEQARKKRMKTIALTGGRRGMLCERADVAICIPSESTQHIQEVHLAVEHLLCMLAERALFGVGEK
ncbi:MAG: SIS domain-containing protein [Terracidiphilus sp.]